jgi:hypothetical protein
LTVAGAGDTQRAGKGLEECFDFVMAGTSVKNADVNVGACAASEAFEEIFDEFCL